MCEFEGKERYRIKHEKRTRSGETKTEGSRQNRVFVDCPFAVCTLAVLESSDARGTLQLAKGAPRDEKLHHVNVEPSSSQKCRYSLQFCLMISLPSLPGTYYDGHERSRRLLYTD